MFFVGLRESPGKRRNSRLLFVSASNFGGVNEFSPKKEAEKIQVDIPVNTQLVFICDLPSKLTIGVGEYTIVPVSGPLQQFEYKKDDNRMTILLYIALNLKTKQEFHVSRNFKGAFA